jgi:NADH:ubiquinone oxidoreductase subunit H
MHKLILIISSFFIFFKKTIFLKDINDIKVKINIIDKIDVIDTSYIDIILLCISSLIIILGLLLLVAYAILAERKVLATIQRRRGPNYVGFLGLLQPIADAIKLLVKETIIPVMSNRIIFIIAPLLTLILSLVN